MVYQDHLTKFCILRPLTSKRAAEVAFQLLDIFLLLGAPSVLQSDSGSEFIAHVITELKVMWPELVMVHGIPKHPQSQGSVERANCDIKGILVCWLGDNNTTVGLTFVQFQKNSSLYSGIKCSLFAALLGSGARTGLSSSSLPPEVLHRLQSEDDLLAAIALPVPDEDADRVTTAADSSIPDPASPPKTIQLHKMTLL
ncbi:KRAB-A domain-containing protein 2-like [Gigantopelta aegis]|uniref:KRAB-A domain-containing protein 2-like n=1 Tax=Gigantopelta aegis TaxID=1735272 RepID=UPI001B8888F0|nr:KRAB-A domain-containing protein 2-like [Gigantopelta aegis]